MTDDAVRCWREWAEGAGTCDEDDLANGIRLAGTAIAALEAEVAAERERAEKAELLIRLAGRLIHGLLGTAPADEGEG